MSSSKQTPPLVADTPLQEIRDIYTFFHTPANIPQIQVASPKTHYAWQNMSGFQYTMQVRRDGPISELPQRINPDIGKVAFARIGGRREIVDQHFEESPLDALLVLHRGNVVYERYKTMRPFDTHMWFSCSKVVSGTMVALLEHEGKVDVKKPVTDYVSALKGSAWDEVTVEDTLDMSTGLDCTEHDEPVDDSRVNPERGWYKWAVSIGLFEDKDHLNQAPFDVLRRMKKIKPGHTAFEYNSINPFVLEVLVNEVTGRMMNEVFGDRVWRKIGAQNDAYIAVTKWGLGSSWGFVNTCLRDMGRWGLVFTPSWKKISGEQIIPDAVLTAIQKGGDPAIYNKGRVGQQFEQSFPDIKGLANRYQWDIVFPDGDIYKGGVGGQGLYVSPARDTVVVWFSTGTAEHEIMGRAIVQGLGR